MTTFYQLISSLPFRKRLKYISCGDSACIMCYQYHNKITYFVIERSSKHYYRVLVFDGYTTDYYLKSVRYCFNTQSKIYQFLEDFIYGKNQCKSKRF